MRNLLHTVSLLGEIGHGSGGSMCSIIRSRSGNDGLGSGCSRSGLRGSRSGVGGSGLWIG